MSPGGTRRVRRTPLIRRGATLRSELSTTRERFTSPCKGYCIPASYALFLIKFTFGLVFFCHGLRVEDRNRKLGAQPRITKFKRFDQPKLCDLLSCATYVSTATYVGIQICHFIYGISSLVHSLSFFSSFVLDRSFCNVLRLD